MNVNPSSRMPWHPAISHMGVGLKRLKTPSRIVARPCAFMALMMLCAAAFIRADTVKLNDGTVLDGDIISENETQLTMEVQFASGTITRKETVTKTDVAQIIRLTPEQKAERARERAFKKLEAYQLDSATSFPLSYYDHVINNVLRQFLIQYPDSSHTKAVQDKLSQWLAERDEVASGQAKYKGQWMRADAVPTRSTASAPATKNEPAPPALPPAPPPAAMNDVLEWLQKYWVYGAVVALAGLWIVSRFFT